MGNGTWDAQHFAEKIGKLFQKKELISKDLIHEYDDDADELCIE